MGGTCSNFLSCGDHGVVDPNEQANNNQVQPQPEASVLEDGGDQVAALPQNEGAQNVIPKRKQRTLHISTEAERRKGLSTTPQGDQKSLYRFFCPICFCYYQEMFKTGCCGNYICEDCGLRHVISKCPTDTELVSLPKDQLAITCPHCAVVGVRFVAVKGNEAIREYAESPGTRLALERARGLGVGKSLKDAVRTPGASSHSSCTRAVSHGDISMPYSKEPATDSGKYILSSSHSDPGPPSGALRIRLVARRKDGASASRPNSAEASPSPDTRARLLTPLTLGRPLQSARSQSMEQLPGAVVDSEPEGRSHQQEQPQILTISTSTTAPPDYPIAGPVTVEALSTAASASSSSTLTPSAPSTAASPGGSSESSADSTSSSAESSGSVDHPIAVAAEAPVLLLPAQTRPVAV